MEVSENSCATDEETTRGLYQTQYCFKNPKQLMKTRFETFRVNVENRVAQVVINRPDKMNAFNAKAWEELQEIFEEIDNSPEVRVSVLSGAGKHFSAGIDLEMLMGMQQQIKDDCEGRMRENMRRFILKLQGHINAIEKCRKPVIASVHGACIGGALDIVAACDMRYCTNDSFFCLKEIDLGIVADLGVLQRLPYLIGEGLTREMAFTARKVSGEEASHIGLSNRAFASEEELQSAVMEIAQQIANKPPLVTRGVKEVLNYSKDRTVEDGLNYVATWNSATILSDDLQKAMMAQMTKKAPEFKD